MPVSVEGCEQVAERLGGLHPRGRFQRVHARVTLKAAACAADALVAAGIDAHVSQLATPPVRPFDGAPPADEGRSDTDVSRYVQEVGLATVTTGPRCAL